MFGCPFNNPYIEICMFMNLYGAKNPPNDIPKRFTLHGTYLRIEMENQILRWLTRYALMC